MINVLSTPCYSSLYTVNIFHCNLYHWSVSSPAMPLNKLISQFTCLSKTHREHTHIVWKWILILYIVLRCEAMPVCTVWRSKATQKAWGTSQEWRLHLIPSKTPGMLFSLTATGDLSSATGGLGKKCSDISLYSSSLNLLLHVSSHFQTNGLHRWRLDFSTVRGWNVLGIREISRH